MLSPLFYETDTIRQGATYIRRYSTCERDANGAPIEATALDTTNMTPRVTLQRTKDNIPVDNAFQMARLQAPNFDPRYDFAMVISRTITGQLSPSLDYFANVDFDDLDGTTTIPHGEITFDVAPGVPHP